MERSGTYPEHADVDRVRRIRILRRSELAQRRLDRLYFLFALHDLRSRRTLLVILGWRFRHLAFSSLSLCSMSSKVEATEEEMSRWAVGPWPVTLAIHKALS